MYKLGITRPQDLARATTLLGRKRLISFSLLKTSASATSREIERFEEVIKATGLSSGVSKTTYGSRLDDVDRQALQLMKQVFATDAPLEIHDLGASDASLSLRWAEQTRAAFPLARFSASDKVLYFTEAIWTRSGESYILEPDGTPIQYTRSPFVVWLPKPEHKAYVVNAAVRHWGLRHISRLRETVRQIAWQGFPDSSVVELDGWRFRQIPLVHPSALAARNGRFKIVEADAFLPLAWQCDVIRAMNLFQRNIFPTEMLHKGIEAVRLSVREGGLFILGKTVEMEDARNDVSFLQKVDGKFVVVEKLGMGSELGDLVQSREV